MVKISVSILEENFSQEAVDKVKSADMIHFDVMDGEFVPRKTIDQDLVADIETPLIKDVHLMINNPEEYVEAYAAAGADRISFHIEATEVPEAVIGLIHSHHIKAGIALNPETDIDGIIPFLEEVDFVLVMSVHPGKGGQKFISDDLEKVKDIKSKFPHLEVSIDGGINAETGKLAIEAGVDVLVEGSYVFSGDPEERIESLRKI